MAVPNPLLTMPLSGSTLTGRVIFWLLLVIPLPLYATLWARVHPAVYIEHSSLALYLTDIPLFFLALLWVKPQHTLTRPGQGLLIPLTALLVLTLTSTQVAPDPILASFFVLRLAYLLGLWWVLLSYPPEPQLVQKGAAVALVGQGLAAVAQFTRQDDLGWRLLGEIDVNRYPGGGSILTLGEQFWLRAYGFTPHPNILGGYLVVLLLLLIPTWLMTSRRAKIWLGIALWWGMLGLFFSFSRSAWLGGSLGLGLVVIAVLGRAEWRKLYTRPLFFLGVAAGFIFLGVGWWQQELVLSRFAPPPTQWQTEVRSIDERQALIEAAGELIQASPMWGVGAGNFALAMSQNWQPRPGVSVQSVHHVPLLLAAELGILGGLLWLWLMVWPVLYAGYSWWHGQLTLWGLGLTAALLAFAVIDLFDYYAWTWVQGQRLRWLLWVLWSAEFQVRKEVKS